MADAKRGMFQILVVWRFDRFARSVKQLVLALEEFRSLHIEFVSHQEALDSSTPLGKAMFTIIGAMAELERNIIRERVLAGMEHARRNGTKSGKSVGRPKAVFDRDEVVKLRHEGLSWRQIASKLRVGGATVRRAHKEWLDSQALKLNI
jgi:DNA invertase Pin-like site-specific DNA recombinase